MTNEQPITRRAALAALGVVATPLLASCGLVAEDTTPAAHPGPAGPPSGGPPSSVVASRPAAPKPQPTFVSDFKIPPIQDGMVPVITRVTTKQPVVFLTIDDGLAKSPRELQLLDQYGYPATLFLTKSAMGENPGFFKAFQKRGDHIQDHTISHNTSMVNASYEYQLGEIVGMRDYITAEYGVAPTLFRPPGGFYSNAMRRAVAAAGLKAIIHWECKANAGHMDFQVGNALRPGDICLMHFRKEFAADLAAFHAAQRASGLTVVRLEDFIGA
ncbi:polysaccharide deacetylase family protein [Arthrobacter sp. NPDC090010]|uniref:polysaccharide deacetylase family protein n=1 Tax=Arthrobacter sp. NPDC090010 TaxID=3363942 RepID=UPI003805B1A7